MKYKIGQEIEITEDFTLKTVGGRELTVKAGDKAIIDSRARIKYISGQARNVMQMLEKGIEVNGYDHVNIAKMIANRLNQVFGLEEFLDDNDIAAESFEIEIEDVLIDMPIVVLVNKNSASSSEILAGALKDLNEATIVGTTTYGKGVIQQFLTLRDGSGLKVTVEEYYTPNRTKINGVGIEPNEKIELPETITNPLTVERKDDTQLQKAIELLKK